MELKNVRILLIEDNPGDVRLIQEIINEEKDSLWDVQVADTLAAGLKCLAAGGMNVILLDLALPDSIGLDTFHKIQRQAPSVPVIMLTVSNDEEMATRAIREGAQDYLVKGQFDRHLLARAILYSLERKSLLMDKELLIAKQRELLDDLKTLNRLLPICAHCKKIRDDQGYWHEVEMFIQSHTNTTFTHGICPKCAAAMFPDKGKQIKKVPKKENRSGRRSKGKDILLS